MVFSFVLGANMLVEKVFARTGIGSYAAEALVVSTMLRCRAWSSQWRFSSWH
jgi:hypothetical protein